MHSNSNFKFVPQLPLNVRESCVLGPLFKKNMIFKPQVFQIWKAVINGQNNMRFVHSVLSQFYLPKMPSMSYASAAK